MDNSKDEWCVAYLKFGKKLKLRKSPSHKDCPDIDHPGRKVGEGLCCSPLVNKAESNSEESKINGKNYKAVLMVRIKPDAIRSCKHDEDYWVINGTTDEIRPYRILYKEC